MEPVYSWFASAIEWMNVRPGLGGWIQGIGTALAGFSALVAGGKAYKGAVLQARAMREAQVHDQEERRRALAAALQGELLYAATHIKVVREYIMKRTELTTFLRKEVDSRLYCSSIKEIGIFGADKVAEIMLAYRGIEMANFLIDKLAGSGYETEDSQHIITMVEVQLNDMAENAMSAVEALREFSPLEGDLKRAMVQVDAAIGAKECRSRDNLE